MESRKLLQTLPCEQQESPMVYKGHKQMLKMLSNDQLELLQATTALDSSQMSLYRSLDVPNNANRSIRKAGGGTSSN